MNNFLAFLLICCGVVSCTPPDQLTLSRKKIKPILNRVIGIAQDDDLILFTALCKRDVDHEIEKKVLDMGIEIERYIDNYIVMRGTKDQIYKMSELDFIYVLEGTSQNTFRKTYRKGAFELEIE